MNKTGSGNQTEIIALPSADAPGVIKMLLHASEEARANAKIVA